MMASTSRAADQPPAIPLTIPPIVGAGELDRLRQDGAVTLVDVRTPAEFESLHIPGSYNVPLDQIGEHGAEFTSVGSPLVLICRSGMRARQAEEALRAADVPRLHVLDGGIGAWEQAGLAVRRGRQAWSIERQVRAIAGGLVVLGTLGSLLVWPPLIILALFVGAGLLFAGITDTCAMGLLLLRMPWNRRSAAAANVPAVLAQLKARAPGATPA